MAYTYRKFKGLPTLAGTVIGFAIGYPGLGFTLGSTIDSLAFKERIREEEIPDEKNKLLTPASLVSSNVPIPLGFGTFKTAGNILDFQIDRDYLYDESHSTPERTNEYEYFFAVGISQNSADFESGRLGNRAFEDGDLVEIEFLPEGGKSTFPESGQSSYIVKSEDGEYPTFRNWNTDWIHFFSSNKSTIYFYFRILTYSKWTGSKIKDNLELEIRFKGDTEETYDINSVDTFVRTLYQVGALSYSEVFISKELSGAGDVVLDLKFTEDFRTDCYYFNFNCLDNTTVTYSKGYPWDKMVITETDEGSFDTAKWAFQCNWFAMKFSTEDLDPDNSNFELFFDQGETNPITNLQNYLTNTEWGLSIPEDKIDTSSFNTMIARCTAESRTFNGLFTSQTDPSEIINSFTRIAQVLPVFSQNEFKLIEDTFTSPAKNFEESNTIADSFQYTRKDVNSMISRLKLDFEDSEHDYAVRSVLLDDVDLFDKIGIKDTSQFQAGVNTEIQAETVGTYLFRNMRQPNTAILKTSINDADIEPGDMYEIIRPVIQHGAVYRAVEVSEESNDEIQVAGVSYFLEEETIEINTEDDFRAGTFNDTKIIHLEDGAVTVS